MKRRSALSVGLVAFGTLCPSAALADGIDLVAYFSRTPCEDVALAIPLVALLMVVNYGLNFLVVGLPARRLGSLPISRILRSLIWLTMFGQAADRIGAILAALLAGLVAGVLGLKGEGSWVAPLLVMNFVFAGIGVGILAFVFAKRIWGLSFRHSIWIATGAGILTNPAWAMGLWFLNG
ncbi:MAG: hypothetical protein K8T26_06775 [Lentisphaerae bacterium]|nr:hypothetical protein [Lentisphaerota bacterium]